MAKPIRFKEANRTLQPGNHPDYEVDPLRVFSDDVFCLSCWKMSFRERLSAFFFGKVLLYVLSGKTQPPVRIEVMRTGFKR